MTVIGNNGRIQRKASSGELYTRAKAGNPFTLSSCSPSLDGLASFSFSILSPTHSHVSHVFFPFWASSLLLLLLRLLLFPVLTLTLIILLRLRRFLLFFAVAAHFLSSGRNFFLFFFSSLGFYAGESVGR